MAAGVDTTGSAPVGVHPVLAALALAQAALSGAAADSCWSLSDGEVVTALEAALSVRSGTEAVTASLVSQAECRGVRAQLAQASTAWWLRRRFQLSSREAHRLTGLAEVLPRWVGVAAALAGGRVGVESAAVITEVLTELPATTSGADATRAEGLLLAQAATLNPGELARCGRALAEALTVAPDLDDPAEAAAVAADLAAAEATEASWWARRGLRLVRRRDGMVGITGHLDPFAGAEVREVLEAAARPVDAVDGVRDERSRSSAWPMPWWRSSPPPGPSTSPRTRHDPTRPPEPRPQHRRPGLRGQRGRRGRRGQRGRRGRRRGRGPGPPGRDRRPRRDRRRRR